MMASHTEDQMGHRLDDTDEANAQSVLQHTCSNPVSCIIPRHCCSGDKCQLLIYRANHRALLIIKKSQAFRGFERSSVMLSVLDAMAALLSWNTTVAYCFCTAAVCVRERILTCLFRTAPRRSEQISLATPRPHSKRPGASCVGIKRKDTVSAPGGV